MLISRGQRELREGRVREIAIPTMLMRRSSVKVRVSAQPLSVVSCQLSVVSWWRDEFLGDAGFQRGDAPIGEAGVVSGSRKAFVETFVDAGQRGDFAAEGNVGGRDAHDIGIRPILLQLGDLTQEFSNAISLVDDLRVGCLEGFLGVERAFPPRSLDRLALGFVGVSPKSASTRCSTCDRLAGFGVLVEGMCGTRRPGVRQRPW